MEAMPVPSLFKCPISLEMMKDPVTLCTGVTYDRESIQRWFQEGHFTCPYTMQTLDTLDLTPNHTLRRLIQGWCFSNPGHCTGNISPKDPANDKQIEQVLLSISNTPTNLGNLRNLADLAKKSERNRAFIVASGGTSVLSSTLCRTRNEADIICGEEVLAVLASLPIHQAEEKCIASLKSSITIDAICWFFCKGSVRARLHSAQILHGLLASDDNFKAVFKPDKEIWENLNFLLRDGCPHTTKTVLEIVLIISPVRRNRIRAVEAGVAVTLIEILPKAERNIAEKALAVLEILCQSAEGRACVCEHPLGIPVLARKLATVSELATEAATGALWQIFKNCGNPFVLKKMEEARAYPKLFLVLQMGSSLITRQKAKEIVKAQKDRSQKNNPCCVVTHQLNAGTFKFEDIHVAKLNA